MSGRVTFSFDPAVGHPKVVPWMRQGRLLAAVTTETLGEIFGPAGEAHPNEFARRNKIALDAVARQKVAGFAERPSEPIILTSDDFA